MGLLDNFVKSSIDGVVIELEKGNTPYVAGEKVMINDCYGYGSAAWTNIAISFFTIFTIISILMECL